MKEVLANVLFVGVVCAAITGMIGVPMLYNIIFKEGIKNTIMGYPEVVEHRFTRLWNMNYTRVTLRTFGGAYAEETFIGHVDLPLGKPVVIRYVYVDFWAHLYIVKRVVEVVPT